jgi:hypothetical protein
VQRGGVLYVSMTMPMMSIRIELAVLYQFSVWVAMWAIDMQLTMAMVPLTAGFGANLKQISIMVMLVHWGGSCLGRFEVL